MAGKRKRQGDSLYKVYLDLGTRSALELYADRLYLHVEDVIEEAVKDFLAGKDLFKLAQRPGKRDSNG